MSRRIYTPAERRQAATERAARFYQNHRDEMLAKNRRRAAERRAATIAEREGRPAGWDRDEAEVVETRAEIDAAYLRAAAQPCPFRAEEFVGYASSAGGWQ